MALMPVLSVPPARGLNDSVFSLRPPSDHALAQLVSDQGERGVFSYEEVGATAATMPTMYRHDRWDTDLGADEGDRFHRAVEALRNWQPQRGAGLRVFPGDAVTDHATFVLVIRAGLSHATAVGRVVWVSDGPDRYAFAYGTLLEHPEQGEEAFAVVRDRGRVRFEIWAFSRPRHRLARLAPRMTRALQVRVTRSYLDAMRAAAA
jgi:uncharacterized protein (UPF0548 family)